MKISYLMQICNISGLHHITKKCCVSKRKLRPSLENLERSIFPSWLLDSDFPHKIRWIISLKFRLTPEAGIISKHIDNSKIITVEIFADAMVRLLHQSSDEIQHDKDPGVVILKGTEWDIVFEDVKISNNLQRSTIKMALKAIGEDEMSKLFNESIKVIIMI